MTARRASTLSAIFGAAVASGLILLMIRTAGASRLPSGVYWFYSPAILWATRSSGNFDAPDIGPLWLGMFLETYALVLPATLLLQHVRPSSRK